MDHLKQAGRERERVRERGGERSLNQPTNRHKL